MVVTGRVVSVSLPADAPQTKGPREHAPDWRGALVEIDRVHKGDPGMKTVVVRFPASHDRMWHRAPKLEAGQRGHFLLHGAAAPAEKKFLTEAKPAAAHYTVLHPEDFEPAEHTRANLQITEPVVWRQRLMELISCLQTLPSSTSFPGR